VCGNQIVLKKQARGELSIITQEVDVWTIWLLILPPFSFVQAKELETNLDGETILLDTNYASLVLLNPLDPTFLYQSKENDEFQYVKTTLIKIGDDEYFFSSPTGFSEYYFYEYEALFGFKRIREEFPTDGIVVLKKRDQLTVFCNQKYTG